MHKYLYFNICVYLIHKCNGKNVYGVTTSLKRPQCQKKKRTPYYMIESYDLFALQITIEKETTTI